MSASLDDELGVPDTATLLVKNPASLKTEGGAAIPVSVQTSNRKSARCLIVGRQQTAADLRIQHGSISRKHAILYYLDNALILKDLGGKHGTTVNGQCVSSDTSTIELKPGDTILFGNVRESVFTVERTCVEEASHEEIQEASNVEQQLEKAGEGLTGRAKRQAEIEAMMASLDETPTYRRADPAPEEEEEETLHIEDADQKLANTHKIPIANRFALSDEGDCKKHTTTCIAVDPAGARFAVGDTEFLKLYAFGGMDQQRSGPFKTLIVEDGYWPISISYSNTGDRMLVGTGSVQPTVLDRDGEIIVKFVRGDMYVTDQSKTVGHTAAVTAVDWHPLERDIVLTASRDGSARLWDLNGKKQFDMLVNQKVFQAKNSKGQRTVVSSICFHPAGREFALGTSCGSIQIWNVSRVSGRPERAVFGAHDTPVSCLTYTFDGTKLASRGDDTIKVWNAQRLSRSSTPMVTCTSAPSNNHEHANCAFGPNAKVLCAGISRTDDTGREVGAVNFYDVSGSKTVAKPLISLPVGAGVVTVQWHPKINQVFVGCSNGETVIYSDSRFSEKGIVKSASKAGRKTDDLSELLRSRAPQGADAITGEIYAPLHNDNLNMRKKKRKRKVEEAPLEPERPATGKHKTGGQAGGNLSLQQFVADQSRKTVIAGKDPREALFQYKEGNSFVERAYEGNKSKLADKTAEEEEEEEKKRERYY